MASEDLPVQIPVSRTVNPDDEITRKNSSIEVTTPHGTNVTLAMTPEMRELQCAACSRLVNHPYHAPCGHTFCQHHLEAVEEGDDELDRTAALLRRLCVDHGFSLTRAREALAASPNDREKAEALCRNASGIEGRAVRVRQEVSEPQFNWGAVSHRSVGRLSRFEDQHAYVDFAEQNRWHCLLSEIEVDEIADKVRSGTTVRIRPGAQPTLGWGALEGDKIGKVVSTIQARVVVQADSHLWFGYLSEVEPVLENCGEEACDSNIPAVLNRLALNTPSDLCRAALGSVLRDALSDPPATRVMLRGDARHEIMTTYGAITLLQVVGYRIKSWDVFRSRTLIEAVGDDLQANAKAALDALEAKFGACPELSPECAQRFSVLVSVDKNLLRKEGWDTYWPDTLKPQFLAAMSPPGARFTWRRRGWESEEEFTQHIKDHCMAGPVAVARGQTKREARQIASSLEGQGLKVKTEETSAVGGLEICLGEDPVELSVPENHPGSISLGARARIVNMAEDKFPENVTSISIGVVGSQYINSADGPMYVVNFPGAVNTHVKAENLAAVSEADAIQPGVRVRVRTGVEPHFGWQGVESSDVGVVHSVQFDGIVNIYMPWIEQLFRATFNDLDTEDLPKVARGNCPVCSEPLSCGEHLAIDMVLDQQIVRLKRLMDGEKEEKNDRVGGAPQRPKLVRTNTHKTEMTCTICLDLMVSPVTLGCGHSFCKAHIEAWLLQHPHCPNCKHRVLPERLHRRRTHARKAALFDLELKEDGNQTQTDSGPPAQAQSADWPEIPVNRMLQSQVLRHFSQDLESRKKEMASEVWEELQQRSTGYLGRLRSFFREFGEDAPSLLVGEGLADTNMTLPGTYGGTFLMLAAEQGEQGALKNLLERQADPLVVASSSTATDIGATALSLAAAQGHRACVENLLLAVEWPAVRLADGLAAAVEQGCSDCVEILLKHREGLADFMNSFGFSAIVTAVQTNKTETIPTLLKHGARLDSALSSGWLVSGAGVQVINGVYQCIGEYEGKPYYQNAAGAVIYFKEWWKICQEKSGIGKAWFYSMPEPRSDTPEPTTGKWTITGYDNSGKYVLPPPFVEQLGGEHGTYLTPLLLAVQFGSMEAARQLLAERADPCSIVPASGETALQIASARGDLGMVRALLEAGAPASSADSAGRGPVHAASAAGHHLIVKELISAKASPDSDALPTPLMLAVGCGNYPPSPGKLQMATILEKYASVVDELLAARADACRRDLDGASVLHLAARTGAIETVLKSLIEAGAPPEATDADGRTPFFSALLAGRDAAATALVKHWGKWEESLRSEYKGLLPLAAAALLGDLTLVKSLLQVLQDQDPSMVAKWLQPADSWHTDLPKTSMRLTCVGLAPNCWQVIQEPSLAYAHEEVVDSSLRIGDRVVLTGSFASFGHASKGPLKPGDIGIVVKKEDKSSKVPYQVEVGGHKFWYRDGALCKHRVEPPEVLNDWRGHLEHPFLAKGRTVAVRIQLVTEKTGTMTKGADKAVPISVTRNGQSFIIRQDDGTLELDGKIDELGSIQGRVIKDGFRSATSTSGGFVLIPAYQDATVRCPRGHAAKRMSPATWRPATCDVCSRPIKRDLPLSFCCKECNYDVCSSCCGAPLLVRLPSEHLINLGSLSPLHIAAAAGQADVVKVLLDARADPLAKDVRGRTPLHWAAAGGHGWTVEVLQACDRTGWPDDVEENSLASIADSHGYVPFSLLPEETLRFACAEEYLQGSSIEVGRLACGEQAAAGIYKIEGERDEKPCYRRSFGAGWAVCWDKQTSRWGLYKERYDAACIQYQNKKNTPRCPIDGWEPVIASEPVPSFEELLPWRAGCGLLQAMPAPMRPKPHELKKIVQSLAPLRSDQPVQIQVGDQTISLPPGAPSLEALITEMIRRGDLPPEPPPGCLQQ